MSRSHNHKLEAKFLNRIIEYSDIPVNLKKKWNRENFDGGHFKNIRNKKRYTIKKHELLNEIEENQNS